jgi:homoserine O-succinyltransferase/O-acetyltransferase
MSVIVNSNQSIRDRQPHMTWNSGKPSAESHDRSSRCLTIGLINNMPDGALEATERQFISLLGAASDGMSIRLLLYSLPEVPRNEFGARRIRTFYASVENLRNTNLDGLIVTGREPMTPNLADEPYWESFTEVVEWARDNTYSTVWSCLAAHAALLHMDGIGRIKSKNKHFGIFECARVSDHGLTADAPSCFTLPHSRWNGIPENQLTRCGYSVLTRAADAGVDTFIKQHKSLFVFFQGHPEYESNTLLLEYRRDVVRYLRGEINTYPLIPKRYFDQSTVAALAALQNEARFHPSEGLLAEFSTRLAEIKIENTWHSTAACIYRNWLEYMCTQKQLRMKDNKVVMGARGVDGSTPAATLAADALDPAAYATNGKGPGTPSGARAVR